MLPPNEGVYRVVLADRIEAGEVVVKFTGTYADCKAYMRARGYRNLDLLNSRGRLASYVMD